MTNKLIHHITHMSNLLGILSEGGIWCDQVSAVGGHCKQSIGYADIKSRRSKRLVRDLAGGAICVGGMVADYVPFYFCNRSPMLGAISQGKVPSFSGGQEEVVYLVSSTQRIAQTELNWCFTNGNAVESVTDFFDNLADLNQVDWDAVKTWKWGGQWRLADPDITRRKLAEFLVHRFFPWSEVSEVGVMNAKAKKQVQQIFENNYPTEGVEIKIQPKWYFVNP